MSTIEIADTILHSLSDEKLQAFITLFADENTIARMETEAILNDPNPKLYHSFREYIEEMEKEDA